MKKIFKLKKCLAIFLLSFFSVGYVSAQITVSGKLTDTKGAPLIAASVAELNSSNGTFTEMDGSWTLSVSSAESVLEFSYMGFA
ncbi:MAG: carboxypeptidase-like regulatory domain-containing protein, partial [Bacteroidales bacterium]|nr:carboxypeptidase-like regulatory domain-containing protein [Bacteroidales bacterium]